MIQGFKSAMRVAYATHDEDAILKVMKAGKRVFMLTSVQALMLSDQAREEQTKTESGHK